MSNYSKLTNFATKDSLASGNPLKVIKGTEIDDEFEAIETSIATKADLASPTFTGTPIAPTAASSTNSTQVATTAFTQAAISAAITSAALTAGTGISISGGAISTASGYNGYGARTVSTSAPSGGSDGDIWYRY